MADNKEQNEKPNNLKSLPLIDKIKVNLSGRSSAILDVMLKEANRQNPQNGDLVNDTALDNAIQSVDPALIAGQHSIIKENADYIKRIEQELQSDIAKEQAQSNEVPQKNQSQKSAVQVVELKVAETPNVTKESRDSHDSHSKDDGR